MESQEDDRAKIAEVLLRGRDFTWQLKNTLENQPHPHPSLPNSSPEQLLNNILLSFADTISILTSSSGEELSPKASSKKSDDSVDSCRSDPILAKERRGCYKRRKTTQTWMRTTPTLVDDGFAWRKYGQKVILNAKYPRNYYRCTHKFDQGCMATKQVQKTDTEPAMYQVTYSGSHCCSNLMGSPQIILDSEHGVSSSNGSILLSFNNHMNDQNGFFSPHNSFHGSSTSVSGNYLDGGAVAHQDSTSSYHDRYLQFTSVLENEDVISGLGSSVTGSDHGSSDIDILVNHVDLYGGMFDF